MQSGQIDNELSGILDRKTRSASIAQPAWAGYPLSSKGFLLGPKTICSDSRNNRGGPDRSYASTFPVSFSNRRRIRKRVEGSIRNCCSQNFSVALWHQSHTQQLVSRFTKKKSRSEIGTYKVIFQLGGKFQELQDTVSHAVR
jgi:hypothetical protein